MLNDCRTKLVRRCVLGVGLSAALSGAAGTATAAVVVGYGFNNSSSAPTALALASATTWTSVGGTLSFNAGLSNTTALQLGPWGTGPGQATRLGFSFSVGNGAQLALDGVSFQRRWGGSGTGGGTGGGSGAQEPFTTFNLFLDNPGTQGVDYTLVAAGSSGSATFSGFSQALALNNLTGTWDVYFTANSPTGAGSWRVEDFALSGTVVPLPPSLVLLAPALLALAARARRAAAH